jgi:hypothetical protein
LQEIVLVGTGADLRIGRTFSVTPFIDFIVILPAERQFGGSGPVVKLGGNVLNFGLALVQH